MRKTKNQKRKNTKNKTIRKNKKGGAFENMFFKQQHKTQNHNPSQTFKKLKCSPYSQILNKNSSYKLDKKTCYSRAHLEKIKNKWNSQNSNNKINESEPNKLWDLLKEKFNHKCQDESCWADTMNEQDIRDLFAPKSPGSWKLNPTEWLTSSDINNVMNQYKKAYKCFDFIGPSPIDFDTMETKTECVWNELCKFNLESQIKKGKFKIGFIFNTDPHTRSGSHWISLFINIKTSMIFYFDSAGKIVKPNIKAFADRVIDQGKKIATPIHFKFDQNYPKRHQYGRTECGIYCLFFIIQMLLDKLTAEYLKKHVINDKYIEQFRNVYYND